MDFIKRLYEKWESISREHKVKKIMNELTELGDKLDKEVQEHKMRVAEWKEHKIDTWKHAESWINTLEGVMIISQARRLILEQRLHMAHSQGFLTDSQQEDILNGIRDLSPDYLYKYQDHMGEPFEGAFCFGPYGVYYFTHGEWVIADDSY